jgi:hypothetical protein
MYIHFIIDIILIFIGLYLVYKKSYFIQKGKNIATKEDIGIITKEIETVKNEIILTVQKKSEFYKESKNAALNFYDISSFFIDYSSKVVDILANNSSNFDLILKQVEDIRCQGAKVISAFLKLYVYYDNGTFTKSAEDFYDVTIKIQRITILFLFKLEQNAQKETLLLNLFKNNQVENEDKLLLNSKNRKDLIENFMVERKNILDNEVNKLRGVFIIELSKIIKI